jgi:hypothetical protein
MCRVDIASHRRHPLIQQPHSAKLQNSPHVGHLTIPVGRQSSRWVTRTTIEIRTTLTSWHWKPPLCNVGSPTSERAASRPCTSANHDIVSVIHVSACYLILSVLIPCAMLRPLTIRRGSISSSTPDL